MARNGAGVYSLPSGNPVVTGTTISSTTYNNTLTDIASALTGSVAADGQTPLTGNLAMGSNKITGLANGSARTDVPAIGQVQDGSFIYVGTVGGTADVITLSPSPAISSYAAGQTFRFIASGANTTNVTVNISSLGAKAITKNGTTALVANDIANGSIVDITYDGTQFQLKGSAIDGSVVHNTLLTTTGDIIYASGANTPARLAVGAAGSILIGGTTPSYSTTATLGTGLQLGSPTGGNKANALNAASGVYDNGNRLGRVLYSTATISNQATLDITLPSGFTMARLDLLAVVPVTNNVTFFARVSTDNGSTYYSGATDYAYAQFAKSSGGVDISANSDATTQILLIGTSNLNNNAAMGVNGKIEIFNYTGTSVRKYIQFTTSYEDTGGTNAHHVTGSGDCYNATAITNALTNIRLLTSSGNLSTGTVKLWVW